MNIAYFRKSTFNRETTVANVKKEAKKQEMSVVGTTDLPSGKGTVIYLTDPRLLGNLIAADLNLIGLMPQAVAVLERDGAVTVGTGSALILSQVTGDPAVRDVANQAEGKLKALIEKSAGVGPLKPSGVKLYSTMTCPYCKMEAAWLNEKKVAFEEVHVDLNQAEAQKMVEKTGQMGVPVTEIRYEDGESEYIVGFDRDKLAQILSVS